MFSLFNGKISGVLTTAFQGLSKAVGSIIEAVTGLIDTTVDILTPILDSAIEVVTPILEQVDKILTPTTDEPEITVFITGLPKDLSTVTKASTKLVNAYLQRYNNPKGDADKPMNDEDDDVDSNTQASANESSLALINSNDAVFLENSGQPISDIINTPIKAAHDFISNTNQIEINDLISAPLNSIGGVIQGVSGALDALLDEIAPITTAIQDTPIVDEALDALDQLTGSVADTLYDVGTAVSQTNLLDQLQINLSLG